MLAQALVPSVVATGLTPATVCVGLAGAGCAVAGIHEGGTAGSFAHAFSPGHRRAPYAAGMTTTTRESRGRMAYTAYCKTVQFKSIRGEDLPMFDEMPEDRREAWIVSANLIWDLATTGRATLEAGIRNGHPSGFKRGSARFRSDRMPARRRQTQP